MTVLSTALPFRRSRKYGSSSICPPSCGCIKTIAGPPVVKLYSVLPVSAPANGFQSLRALSVQRVPGPGAAAKS